jgi:hypothetical protein
LSNRDERSGRAGRTGPPRFAVLASQFAANSEKLVDDRFAEIVQLVNQRWRTDH